MVYTVDLFIDDGYNTDSIENTHKARMFYHLNIMPTLLFMTLLITLTVMGRF